MLKIDRFKLLDIVSYCSGIPSEIITGKDRQEKHILPRHLYFYLLRKKYGFKYVEIAKIIGSDHTTVIHAVNKIQAHIDTEDILTINLYDKIHHELNIYHSKQRTAKIAVTAQDGQDISFIANYLVNTFGCTIEYI